MLKIDYLRKIIYSFQTGEKWLNVKMSSEIEVLVNEAVSLLDYRSPMNNIRQPTIT